MSSRLVRLANANWERFSLVLVMSVWAAARALQLQYLGWGTGFDVNLYQQYASQWGTGAAAYVDFHPEYPPGALPVFLLPLLWGGAANYSRAFAAEMACFDLASALLVLRWSQLSVETTWLRSLFPPLLYIAITAALYPVLYTRFDLVPGALVLAALYCLQKRRLRVSAILLGMAGAVKLWPFALVPIWLWVAWRGSFRRAAAAAFWIGAGAVLIALPLLPRAGWQVASFLKYHAARGIQIETTWSTLALLLNLLGVTTARVEHNFGAFHVAGRLPTILATLSLPLTVVFALAPQVAAIARGLRQNMNSDRVIEHAVFGAVVGFMIAGKVLSPQFILWIAPLLPLAAKGPAGSVLALATAVLTTVVYPYLSPALEQREPGHGLALAAVGSRNLLLFGWYGVAMYRALGTARQSSPATAALGELSTSKTSP